MKRAVFASESKSVRFPSSNVLLTIRTFISNPSDELALKKPEHRQRVVEGLYNGIEQYLQNLNSLTYNQLKSPGPGR